jgi:hypothetical protein
MGSKLLRIATFVLALLGLVAGMNQMLIEWRFAGIEDLARRIEGGLIPEPSFWPKFEANGHSALSEVASCETEATKAQLTVSLSKFDSLSRGADLQARDQQRLVAIAAAKRSILCGPMDGDAWFRLGLLELGAQGPTPDVLSYFATANRLTPSEGWLIRIRTPIYADLANRGVTNFREQAIRDAMVFTAFGHDPARALNWLAAWPDMLRSGFMEGLSLVSFREHRWYFSLASDFGVDIGQDTKGTVIIDPFTRKPFNQYVSQ